MGHRTGKAGEIALILSGLGLSDNEAQLYELLLGRAPSTVHELRAFAPFPRTMLYHVLSQLARRGLVTMRKDGWRTVYIPEDPEHLYDLLAKKEQEFAQESDHVRELIPHLKRRYRLAGKRPSVRAFDGVEEYQHALEDIIIDAPTRILSYQSIGMKRAAHEVRAAHDATRVHKKIVQHVLFFESKEALREIVSRRYDDYTQFRSIPKSAVAPFSADVTLYDGKLLYTTYAEQEPSAILIEDPALFEMQKQIFETFWKQGTDRTLAYTEAL